jgi:hypothetical protein
LVLGDFPTRLHQTQNSHLDHVRRELGCSLGIWRLSRVGATVLGVRCTAGRSPQVNPGSPRPTPAHPTPALVARSQAPSLFGPDGVSSMQISEPISLWRGMHAAHSGIFLRPAVASRCFMVECPMPIPGHAEILLLLRMHFKSTD